MSSPAQYLKSIAVLSSIILVTTLMVPVALSQSGRGRPKVPQPSPSASQPQPIKIPAAAAVIKQEQSGTTSRFVLQDGITVIINEQHNAPIAAAVVYFKVSQLDESFSMSATRRLLQHMLLRGTVLRPGDRALADLRAIGALIEADSSLDGASLSIVAPTDRINDALAIQADMVQNPSLDEDAMRREIPLVIEELKRGPIEPEKGELERNLSNERLKRLIDFDDPSAYSLGRVFNLAFTGDVSSRLEPVPSITRQQLVEFYHARCRPENLIVSVVGDVSTFNALVQIQQLYGEFGAARNIVAPVSQSKPPQSSVSANREPTAPKPTFTTEQASVRYAAERADISQSVVSVSFRVPGAESKDWAAIELLGALAGRGRASRLNQILIDGQMAANRVESNCTALAGTGLLTFQIWVAAGSREAVSIDKTESALFKELDRLRREAPSEAEIARARAVLEERFIDQTASYRSRARMLARAEAAGVGFSGAFGYRARIRAVQPEDVRRAAAKYLSLSRASVHEYEPLSSALRTFDAESFAKTVTVWAPGFAQPVESVEVRAADAKSPPPVAQGPERTPERQAMIESVQPLPIKDFSTLNGPKAFVREDHSQPKVTIAILFQGGRDVEDASDSGLTELMLRSILYGTPRRTGSQMMAELDGLGAQVHVVVEPDFFGFVLSTLSRNGDRALKLLRDAIEEPALRDDDVARAKLGQIALIRELRDSSAARARELLLESLFPGHAYSLPKHGREEIVASLTSDKLREWHVRLVKRQLPLAVIVGDTDGSALVSSVLAEGFRRRDLDATIQLKTPQPGTAAEKAESRAREQTALAIGFVGPKANGGDLDALRLIEAAVNGEGGRLLRGLRQNQNVVFAAAVSSDAMFAAGEIAAYALTSPESEQRARSGLAAELASIAREGLSGAELASARPLAATSHIEMAQSQEQHALEYARAIFYGKPASDADSFADRVSKLSSEDIKRVASACFKPSASATAVVRGSSQKTPH
ncbi:MAG TPA: pitrilysin family protein [Blastocatellia bacterium]